MSRLAELLLLLAACGSTAAPPERKEAVETKPVPRVIEPITGVHGGAINTLAVTSDGRAAITGDTTGGLRLWPTLDGTREPIVIAGPIAAELAIVRDGAGFAIAVGDAAKHVVLIRLDNKGHLHTRTSLGEAEQVAARPDGFLLLRADQVIDHVLIDGSLRAQLAAEGGTRVRSLATHDDAAIAIVESEKQTTARRIDMPALTWGKQSAALSLDDESIAALTADHEFLLAMGAAGRMMRFELATGAGKPACPETSGRFGRFDGFDLPSSVSAIPFGDKVACLVDGSFSWFDVENEWTTTVNVGGNAVLVMAGAADRVVVANDHHLLIATPDRTDFLGYGFHTLSHVRPVPAGVLIANGDQQPVLLDDDFREHARFTLPKTRVPWTDLVPLDDRYVLATTTRASGDTWGSAYQIGIYDIVKQAMHQVLPYNAHTGELEYEPSTQLLAASDGEDRLLVRMDPESHTLGNAITLAIPTATKRLALTDPKLSGGLVALAVQDVVGGGLLVRELYAADLPRQSEIDGKSKIMQPRRSHSIAGELLGVDRAGRVYVREAPKDVIAIYVGGERRAEIAGAQGVRLRPSPDGKYVAVVEEARVTLFAVDGRRLWDTAAWGATNVDWTPRGILYAQFPGALARIEVATGALVERQCGWGFGMSSTPLENPQNAPSVCDVF